jgi:hypothetical protein
MAGSRPEGSDGGSVDMEGSVGVLWAGKKLTDAEELQLRRTVALLHRMEGGAEELKESRANLERFLPENDHLWTPNELESGAYLGPWMDVGAEVTRGEDSLPDSDPLGS